MNIAARTSRCPLCRSTSEGLITFDFASKPPLSDTINFRWCCDCDFIFAEQLDAESYREFYRSALHDTAHVSDKPSGDNLHHMQAQLLRDYLGTEFCGTCLDYGCGEGQLLAQLAEVMPKAYLFGTDLRNSLRSGTPARFLESLGNGPSLFDAIILSHVAEHLIDLTDLSGIVRHLAPDGVIYVEVPDPLAYPECPRREFMYYFDRLHVNHFSPTAMDRWLAQHGLQVVRRGSHRFAYRDGQYPAQYVFARRSDEGGRSIGCLTRASLRQAFDCYCDGETARGSSLRNFILASAAGRDLLAYGRGDNYFRAKASSGPLAGLHIEAVLDQNAANLTSCGDLVLLPEVGLARYPKAVLLMTVSAGADEIAAKIHADTSERDIIMI